MAFTGSTLTTSFKAELLQGVHNLSASTGDTFYMALYDNTATLSASTTVYTSTGEISGAGYTAGGQTIASTGIFTGGSIAYVDFASPTWSGAFTARGALIYNSSKGNRTVAVIDFGIDKTSTVTFTVTMPVNDANNAIIRII